MNLNKTWFTLMELLVAMSIIIILTLLTYIPYNHYQNKAKLKLSSREISQSFYEAKNMATSWLKDLDWNRSIWIYLENNELTNDSIVFFSYPHDIDEINIQNIESWDIEKIKTKKLQKWIKINDLWWYDNLLFFYESITWNSKVYTFDSWWKHLINQDEISIVFSYRNSTSPTLRTQLVYFTKTNIVDYR